MGDSVAVQSGSPV
jgi:hypothetical protein